MHPKIWAVCPFSRPKQLEWVFEHFDAQAHPSKAIVFVFNGDARDMTVPTQRRDVHVVYSPANVSDAMNTGLEFVRRHAVRGDWFAKWDDDDFYSPRYLADIAQASSNARAIGRTHVWCKSQSNRLWSLDYGDINTNAPHGPTLAASIDIAENFPATGDVPWGEDVAWWKLMRSRGVLFTNLPRDGFCWMRYASEDHHHTCPLGDAEMQSMAVGGVIDYGGFSLDVVNGLESRQGTECEEPPLDFDAFSRAIERTLARSNHG